MTDQEKIDIGFDVRNVPEKNRNKVDRIESKAIQNPYAKKYMEDKKTLVVKENIVGMLTHVKEKRNLGSTNETIKFLCDLEKELTRKQMLKEFATCPDCGVSMSIDHVKKIHQHVDKDSECYGCFKRDHKIELGTKVVENAKDKKRLKDEQSEQIDTSDELSEQTIAEIKVIEQKIAEGQFTKEDLDAISVPAFGELWTKHDLYGHAGQRRDKKSDV